MWCGSVERECFVVDEGERRRESDGGGFFMLPRQKVGLTRAPWSTTSSIPDPPHFDHAAPCVRAAGDRRFQESGNVTDFHFGKTFAWNVGETRGSAAPLRAGLLRQALCARLVQRAGEVANLCCKVHTKTRKIERNIDKPRDSLLLILHLHPGVPALLGRERRRLLALVRHRARRHPRHPQRMRRRPADGGGHGSASPHCRRRVS